MTVKKLKELLENFPEDAQVKINTWEELLDIKNVSKNPYPNTVSINTFPGR